MVGKPEPQVIKSFSILNSAEHEVLSANELQITDKYSCFLAQFS